MALLFTDSFDHYATADILEKYTQILDGGSSSALAIGAYGRRSSNGIKSTAGNFGGQPTCKIPAITLAPSGAVCGIGFAWRQATNSFAELAVGINGDLVSGQTTTCNALVVIRQLSVTQGYLRINTNGTVCYWRGTGAGGVLLGTTTNALSVGTLYFIELLVSIDPSVGTVELRVNGETWLSLTGQNTRAAATSGWNELYLNKAAQQSGTGLQWDMDDLYILDGSGSAPWNTFLGDCRVDALFPNAAGSVTGWTPSAGANYQCVDDNPPNDDTDFVAANAAGLIDTYNFADAPVAGSTIRGVQVVANIRKTDAGACSVAAVVRQGGANLASTPQNPGTTYAFQRHMFQANPHTGAAWTSAEVTNNEFGLSRTA